MPCPDLPNVALNKPAYQSSLHSRYGRPGNAVDGNRATDMAHCTETVASDKHPNRWFRVDLVGLYEVFAVVLTNRGNCVCGQYYVLTGRLIRCKKLSIDCWLFILDLTGVEKREKRQ